MHSFSSNFWGNVYNDTRGFEALSTRVRSGKKLIKAIELYLRNRAKCEEEYSRRLIKCAHDTDISHATGTMKRGLEALLGNVDEASQLHVEKANAYNRVAQEAAQFRMKQKPVIASLEKSASEAHAKYRKQYETCTGLNSRYVKLHKDYELMRKEHEVTIKCAANLAQPQQKEIEKLELKVEKARQNLEQAESAYYLSVNVLEETRLAFIKEFTLAANEFELLERERIEMLRNLAWIATNIESKADVDDDLAQERVRKVLEACDHEVDLVQFVSERRTGSDPPDPVAFEDCKTKEKRLPQVSSSSNGSSTFIGSSASFTNPIGPAASNWKRSNSSSTLNLSTSSSSSSSVNTNSNQKNRTINHSRGHSSRPSLDLSIGAHTHIDAMLNSAGGMPVRPSSAKNIQHAASKNPFGDSHLYEDVQ